MGGPFSVNLVPMEYNNVRYLELVGDSLLIRYTDGKILTAVPDGRGRFIPKRVGEGEPPGTYDPWEPPVDPPAPGDWQHPLEGAVLTSGFGWRAGGFHYGIDLSTTTAPTGGPVRSVTEMLVTVAVDAFEGGNVSGGTHVKGHSLDGAYTFAYYHGADESLLVSVGDTIPAGGVLFTEGATGNVSGTHVHFEISLGNHVNPWPPPYNNGVQFVDPLPILRENGVAI